MKKKWIIVSSALLVGLMALGIGGKKAGWWGETQSVVSVEVAEITLETLIETVNASGKVQPSFDIKISPEVSGEIRSLYVVEGQKVKKGELLAQINPDIYQSQVSRVRASVNVAKASKAQADAQYYEAKRMYERSQSLHVQGVISEAEWDQAQRLHEVAQLNVESAKYQWQSAESSLTEAQDNLKRTSLRAPIDGTVTGLNVELGERVVGTAQMAGTEMMRISQLETMEVVVDVNENDIIKVKMGDTAYVEVDAYLNKRFKALVTEIGGAAKSNGLGGVDQVTNFEVVMTVLPDSYLDLMKSGNVQPLRPGMTATVDILTSRVVNVTSAPIQAVTTRANDKEKKPVEVVFLLKEGKAVQKTVQVGIQDDRFIHLVSGVKKGDKIISGPYDQLSGDLKDGDAVKIADSKKPKDEKE